MSLSSVFLPFCRSPRSPSRPTPLTPAPESARVSALLKAALCGSAQDFQEQIHPHIRCVGFPEFTPHNREELFGFFNYLLEVFAEPQLTIEELPGTAQQATVEFCVRGRHREEFMGLPATGGQLQLCAQLMVRTEAEVITDMWICDKRISLTTTTGSVYRLHLPREQQEHPLR
ncbi:ester cyclase [Cellvibrio japonicus]|uniref:Uncharacterized protein n=1 Tax=Cellvibrio japonicus (strain Ueda107) TaxID=498211 RepID=B3PH82_CELJU|nr:ester cyclase [Cellvibrio japonicus]ACE84439.1 hypothetical protein CJA_0279 [Cellvibrio japonicus Ueda107]